MQYIELKEKLNEYVVFTLQDIKKVDTFFYRSRLNDWQDKGYLKKIRRGYYIFTDQALDEAVLFNIANKIYSPSYISFEMALSNYSLIPESVYGITSATSNKTNRFKTEIGEFIYSHLRPELMFGYELIMLGGVSYKMAEIEKSILDYFYINSHLKTDADLSELRINEEEFKTKVNYEKLMKYLDFFNNKSLERRIKTLLKYMNYANT
jgi:predicted transcriptional regulator of viral defense system